MKKPALPIHVVYEQMRELEVEYDENVHDPSLLLPQCDPITGVLPVGRGHCLSTTETAVDMLPPSERRLFVVRANGKRVHFGVIGLDFDRELAHSILLAPPRFYPTQTAIENELAKRVLDNTFTYGFLVGFEAKEFRSEAGGPTETTNNALFVNLNDPSLFFRGFRKRMVMKNEETIPRESNWNSVVRTQEFITNRFPELTVFGEPLS